MSDTNEFNICPDHINGLRDRLKSVAATKERREALLGKLRREGRLDSMVFVIDLRKPVFRYIAQYVDPIQVTLSDEIGEHYCVIAMDRKDGQSVMRELNLKPQWVSMAGDRPPENHFFLVILHESGQTFSLYQMPQVGSNAPQLN